MYIYISLNKLEKRMHWWEVAMNWSGLCLKIEADKEDVIGAVMVPALYPLKTIVKQKPSLTHWGRDKWTDDIFKCTFLNENVWIPIKISLKFVPKGQINNISALV